MTDKTDDPVEVRRVTVAVTAATRTNNYGNLFLCVSRCDATHLDD